MSVWNPLEDLLDDAERQDTAAQWRGFHNADHYLDLASEALEDPGKPPRWVWREYRAIFMGMTWIGGRMKGGR